MKRGLAVLSVVSTAFFVLACGPVKEPKQASAPDPVEDTGDSSSASGGSSSGSSSSSSSSSHGAIPDNLAPPPSSGKVVKGEKGEAPVVSSLAQFQEGLHWGMSHDEVTKLFTQTGGVIAKDYNERLEKARVGPEMTAIEAERERQKAAFRRSFLEFKDTPTGYDSTALAHEFTYKNKEALMWVQREGKKRFFFFINDRLWKIYDEVPLGDSGAWGKTYLDAVNTMNGKLGAQGRVLGADDKKGIYATTVDYKDGSSHLRLVDRSTETLVGIVVEDNNTLARLASLRTHKAEDPNAIDPTVAAVTTKGLSDPNAPQAAASGKPSSKKAPPKKKKK
jgi:hypothetical protein